jgi:hypothetical protein
MKVGTTAITAVAKIVNMSAKICYKQSRLKLGFIIVTKCISYKLAYVV